MNLTMLKGKIHRAVVTQAELNYVGSITIDSELLEAAGILEYEMVQIVDVQNGNRFETYTIAGEPGSGMICLNGAAARQVSVGDNVIIMCYASYSAEEAKEHKPKVVFVDEKNKATRVTNYEKHGELGQKDFPRKGVASSVTLATPLNFTSSFPCQALSTQIRSSRRTSWRFHCKPKHLKLRYSIHFPWQNS